MEHHQEGNGGIEDGFRQNEDMRAMISSETVVNLRRKDSGGLAMWYDGMRRYDRRSEMHFVDGARRREKEGKSTEDVEGSYEEEARTDREDRHTLRSHQRETRPQKRRHCTYDRIILHKRHVTANSIHERQEY